MLKKFRNFLSTPPAAALLYWLVRAYSLTFRLRVENEKPWLDFLEAGGVVLLCCWHQQFFSAIRYFQKYRKYSPSLMISKSRDGELIAGVARRTGWKVERGSSSRDGAEALKGMIENLKRNRLAAHIVDGPRGPAGQVKPGAIRLAQAAGAVVVPFFLVADRAWFFNSWDRFMVPKPLTKVRLVFGEMTPIHQARDEVMFESMRASLEKAMAPGLIV
ncbi:MAG: lysophospholipid acyltransferase family protein [Pseudomonadota bacterium]